MPKERGSKKVILISVVSAIAVLLIGAIVAVAYLYKENKDLKKDTNAAAASEQKRIVSKVEVLYNTPKEEPSLIQVQDPDKIKNQQFFADAQKGDYVLVYKAAKLAIMYREKTNKIINTGPIVLDDDKDTEGSSDSSDDSSSSSTPIDGTSSVDQ